MIGYIILNLILGFGNFLLTLNHLDKQRYKSMIFSGMVSGFCFGIVFAMLIQNQ
jgi:hypothetical protein